jgi:hypothetical protein
MEYNCALIKEDWLAAINALRVVALYWSFPPALAYNFHNQPVNGKQRPMYDKTSQTQLNNKQQGNLN